MPGDAFLGEFAGTGGRDTRGLAPHCVAGVPWALRAHLMLIHVKGGDTVSYPVKTGDSGVPGDCWRPVKGLAELGDGASHRDQ